MDGMLSQEEINALLGGMSTNDSSEEVSSDISATLSDEEKDAIGEISNICMGTAATTLYSLVNQKVVITTPNVTLCKWEDITSEYQKPCVIINISYREGIEGNNVLILKEDDVKVITDLMMGGDGTNLADELTDLHLSAISEAMNQMMGSAATSLSSMLEKKIDISPPSADLIDMSLDMDDQVGKDFKNDMFVKILFKMEIGDLVDSNIMQLYPVELAKDLYSKFSNTKDDTEPVTNDIMQPQASLPNASGPQMMNQQMMNQQPMMNQQMMNQPMMNQQMMGQQSMTGQMQYGYGNPNTQDVNVQPVQFQAFNAAYNPMSQQENIELIMDVPLEVTAELGRASKSIKEILEFAPGTIIELDKIAGEPIDVLVNGKLVARGEVVVIEEDFGIRVTDIIK